jgi:hypothetical protein
MEWDSLKSIFLKLLDRLGWIVIDVGRTAVRPYISNRLEFLPTGRGHLSIFHARHRGVHLPHHERAMKRPL